MTTKETNNYMAQVTNIEVMAPTRIRYHVGDKFMVEATRVFPDLNNKNANPILWKKYGYVNKIFKSYIAIDTFYIDENDVCYGYFNPTVIDTGNRRVINFDMLREVSEENEQELVAEAIKLYNAGVPA